MRAIGMIGLMATVLATSAQADETMPNTNLVCDGTELIMRDGEPTQTLKFHAVYRIDYETKQWCEDTCKDVRPILYVTNDSIGLMLRGVGAASFVLRLDRIKGEVEGIGRIALDDGKSSRQYFSGPCTPQPFTGVQPPPPGPKPVPKF